MSMSRLPAILVLALLTPLAAACGHKIGDSCSSSTDCSQDGTRVCDIASPDGYCTKLNCDFGTCPSEAVCIRFYPGVTSGRACDPAGIGDDCGLDEVCTVQGICAPRSIEQHYCMLKCDTDSDCRTQYECRTLEVMALHGGEPVPDPASQDPTVPNVPFCAPGQPCLNDSDCTDPGYHCTSDRVCVKQ